MTGKAIYARLNASVAALSGRIYPDSAPPTVKTYPLTAYQCEGQIHVAGDDSTYSEVVNFATLASTPTEAATIGAAIRTALHNQRGTWGGVNIERALDANNGGNDGDAVKITDGQASLWLIEQTFTVWVHT